MSAEPAPERRDLDGNREHDEALNTLFAQPGRTLRIFDKALSNAYNTPARTNALRRFLLASRMARLRIVVHDASNITRDCPRLVELLRDFSHAASVQETMAEAKGVYDPFAVMDELHYVHRFHHEQTRGVLMLNDAQGAHELTQRFEDIWEASSPSSAATTLGL